MSIAAMPAFAIIIRRKLEHKYRRAVSLSPVIRNEAAAPL